MKRLKWIVLLLPLSLAFLGARRLYWYAASAQPQVVSCAEAATDGLPAHTLVRLDGCEVDLEQVLVEEWTAGRRSAGVSLELLVPTWAGERALAVVHLDGSSPLGERLRAAREEPSAGGRLRFDVEGWVSPSSSFNASERRSLAAIPGFADVDALWSIEEGGRPGWTGGALELAAALLFGVTFLQILTRRRA